MKSAIVIQWNAVAFAGKVLIDEAEKGLEVDEGCVIQKGISTKCILKLVKIAVQL